MTLTTLNMKTVILPTLPEDGFMPSPERCEAVITPKTKAIVLVTPNNPVRTRSVLSKLTKRLTGSR